MKIRMKVPIGGTFHNDPDGVKRGDIVDVPEEFAKRYIANDLAEPASKSKAPVEKATLPQDDVEKASLDVPPDDEDEDDGPKPLDEDEDETKAKAEAAKARRAARRAQTRAQRS